MFSEFRFFPEQASTLAPDVDQLYLFIVAVTAFFGILVTCPRHLLRGRSTGPTTRWRSARRSPARSRSSSRGRSSRSSSRIVIFVWATEVFFDLYRPPDQTLEIYATGKRWMWKFQHLDGKSEINELHVPVGRAGQGDVHVGRRAALAVSSRRSAPRPTPFRAATAASGSTPRRSASTTSSAPSTAARITPG